MLGFRKLVATRWLSWSRRRCLADARAVLVYGANTDVGKTVASAALCRHGLAAGRLVTYIKPVQTGTETDAGALDGHCRAAGQRGLATETLFHYPSPESPATAAEKAGARAPADPELREALQECLHQSLRQQNALAVVETAGGPLSPGPSHALQADIYAPLKLRCVLVGDARLGGISATLCAFEALRSRGQTPELVLFCGGDSGGDYGNEAAVRRALNESVKVASLPAVPATGPLTEWMEREEVASAMRDILTAKTEAEAEAEVHEHLRLDREHLWHPYTSMVKPGRVWSVRSADGCMIELQDGRRLVDGMASWWCAIHGYNVPELNAAAAGQLSQMSHIMFGGLTHRPATDLTKLLLQCAPPGLSQVFLCDSGSVSVEVAIKMALQYWAMRGIPSKCRLATVQRGYHGDTFGAMSVCDPVRGMHTLFQSTLAQQLFADPPAMGEEEDSSFASMEDMLRRHHEEIAAVIIEPVVQGAGGMRIYNPSYLVKLRRLCDELDVLLIFDEIATGFGRTGKLFAAEHAGISPDIMCIGKALTGGYCTLGATLASQKVAHGVSGSGEQPLMHGPTFMANPLACAIAAASIQLLLQSPWQSRVNAIQEQLQRQLAPLVGRPEVQAVRSLGAIGVVELKRPPKDPRKLQESFVEQGVWLRPFGQTIYTMPPYVISEDELSQITGAMVSVLEAGVELAD